MNLSQEQRDVLAFITEPQQQQHLVVNAKAGSGKSTITVLAADIRRQEKNKRTLVLTFSKNLKFEGRERAVKYGLSDHLLIHSFHSAVAEAYNIECYDEVHVHDFLENGALPIAVDWTDIDLIVLDEAQDLNHDMYRIAQRLRSLLAPNHRLMVLGDYFQVLFASMPSRRASCKYLANPAKYFGGDFRSLPLSTSYRLTQAMSDWINTNLDPRKLAMFPAVWSKHGPTITRLWGEHGIRGNPTKVGQPVRECYQNLFDTSPSSTTYKTLKSWSTTDHQNIAIVAQSISMNSPMKQLVEKLSGDPGQNWLIKDKEFHRTTTCSEKISHNKGVVSTIHAMKGLERRFVMVFGFDHFIEKLVFDPDDPDWPLHAYCLAYVACTRAQEELFVASSMKEADFFTKRHQPHTMRVRAQPTMRHVHSLLEYVPYDAGIEKMVNERVVCRLDVDEDDVSALDEPIPGRGGTFEDMGYYYMLAIQDRLHRLFQDNEFVPDWVVTDWVVTLKDVIKTYSTKNKSPHIMKQLQITDFHVPTKELDMVLHRLLALLHLEQQPPQDVMKNFLLRRGEVTGTVDFVLCASNHLLQLELSPVHDRKRVHEAALYGAMFRSMTRGNKPVHVYIANPVIGALYEIVADDNHFDAALYRKKC